MPNYIAVVFLIMTLVYSFIKNYRISAMVNIVLIAINLFVILVN